MVYTTQIENTKITTMLHSVPSVPRFLSPCSSSVSYFCLPYHLHLSDLSTSAKNVLGLRHLAWVNESKWFGHIQVEFRDRFCCQPYSCQMGWQLQCKQNMINRSSRRKRGMVSNPLFIIPDFFCIFPWTLLWLKKVCSVGCLSLVFQTETANRADLFPCLPKGIFPFPSNLCSHSWVILENAKNKGPSLYYLRT